MSLAPEFWSVSAVTAETASGTSDSASLRRVAVTTISLVSPPVSGSTSWLSTAAPSAVAPWVGSAAPASVSVSWAYAGIDSAIRPAESSHVDLRILNLPVSNSSLWAKGVIQRGAAAKQSTGAGDKNGGLATEMSHVAAQHGKRRGCRRGNRACFEPLRFACYLGAITISI